MRFIQKIKSLLLKNEHRNEVVSSSEYGRVDKLIESRIKSTYVFLTVVSTITYFIFKLWIDCIDMYKLQTEQGADGTIQTIVLCSFMFPACVINIFAALKSIIADSEFMQPLVEIKQTDIILSNLLYRSVWKTAALSICSIIFLFIGISAVGDRVYIIANETGYGAMVCLLLMYSLICLYQKYKRSVYNILFARIVLCVFLFTFTLLSSLQICEINDPVSFGNKKLALSIDIVDWIQIVVSLIGLAVTIWIARLQFKQGERMEKLEQEIARRDEARHIDTIQTESANFLIKYNKELDLLPLCLMANLYNRTLPYNRKMYVAFNSLSTEVQDLILKKQGIKLPRYDGDFYDYCYKHIVKYLNEAYPDERNNHFMYEYGKYFISGIKDYAKEQSMINNHKYTCSLTDDLAGVKQKFKSFEQIILKRLGKNKNKDKLFCDTLSIAIYYAAIYGTKQDVDNDELLELLPEINGIQCRMEDTFLMALLAIYIQSIVNISEKK